MIATIIIILLLFTSNGWAIVLPPGGPYDTPAVSLKKGEKYAGYTFTRNWTDPKITLTFQVLYSPDGKVFTVACQTVFKGGPPLTMFGKPYTAGLLACQAPANAQQIMGRGIVAGGTIDITITKK